MISESGSLKPAGYVVSHRQRGFLFLTELPMEAERGDEARSPGNGFIDDMETGWPRARALTSLSLSSFTFSRLSKPWPASGHGTFSRHHRRCNVWA